VELRSGLDAVNSEVSLLIIRYIACLICREEINVHRGFSHSSNQIVASCLKLDNKHLLL
jgi:hypothetical protein